MPMRDFMLLTRPSPDAAALLGDRLGTLLGELTAAAKRACPQIEWRAEFDLGPQSSVRIFSAPDFESAMRVSELARRLDGVRAEVTPLRAGW